jgi:hypothetical protein
MKNDLYMCSQIIHDSPHEVEFFLWGLSQRDDDFNGNNGEEYLWDIAKEAGFKTNYEYTLAEAKKEADAIKCIQTFLEIWMESDRCYQEYRLNIERKGKKLFISFAYTVDMS